MLRTFLREIILSSPVSHDKYLGLPLCHRGRTDQTDIFSPEHPTWMVLSVRMYCY